MKNTKSRKIWRWLKSLYIDRRIRKGLLGVIDDALKELPQDLFDLPDNIYGDYDEKETQQS